MRVTIWHNPRCSKSRATLTLLEEKGISPEIRLYLEKPPSEEEIGNALDLLGIGPRNLMRKGEPAYKKNNLGAETLGRGELISAMAANPILIERPVVFANGKAAIGRPPENILGIL